MELTQEIKDINEAIESTTEASNENIANYLKDRIPYNMCKDVLVKPLEQIMIKKEFRVPVVDDTVVEEGEVIHEYENTAVEVKEVPSNFAKGIVLKTPLTNNGGAELPFNVGDTIVYNNRFSIEFDIFKNSVLVKPYDIVAIEI